MSLVGDIQNFCNYVNTKLIVASVLTRESSTNAAKTIGKLNSRWENKYKPHYREFISLLEPLNDKVHLSDETYVNLATELVQFSLTAPSAKPNCVNQMRLPAGF